MTRKERVLKKHAEERARRAFNRQIRIEMRIRRRQGLAPLSKDVTILNLSRQGKLPNNIPLDLTKANGLDVLSQSQVRKPCGGCQAARRRLEELKQQAKK